jgi:hypothetical protein
VRFLFGVKMENLGIPIVDFAIYRGDDRTVSFDIFTVDNDTETPFELANRQIDLWATPEKGSTLKLSTADNSITVQDNTLLCHFSHELTKDIKWESAVYDCQIIIDGKYKTMFRGELTVEFDVTKEEENG